MIGEPKVEERSQQPYVGIRTQATMQELGEVIPRVLERLETWLEQQGIAAGGAPFIRYHVIDMDAQLDIELGVPLDPGAYEAASTLVAVTALSGDESLRVSTLPAGRYAALEYAGVRNGIPANKALLDWGAQQGLAWDQWSAQNGDGFGARYETFLTGPDQSPDPDDWRTEVAIRLAE